MKATNCHTRRTMYHSMQSTYRTNKEACRAYIFNGRGKAAYACNY